MTLKIECFHDIDVIIIIFYFSIIMFLYLIEKLNIVLKEL